MDEKDERGVPIARIVFEEPWLALNGRPVPHIVPCELSLQDLGVRYEFGVDQGVWLLKESVCTHGSVSSLCRRSLLRTVTIGDLPDELFPAPADLDIPEHSVTFLAPGERLLAIHTADGLSLEANLSIPSNASEPVPVVFFMPGAGPWTFDRPLVYPDLEHPQEMMPEMKFYSFSDFFARELTSRGLGFFKAPTRRLCRTTKKPSLKIR
jgi:hypothetical protein